MYPKMMQIVSQYPTVDFFKVCLHSRLSHRFTVEHLFPSSRLFAFLQLV